MKSHLFLFTIGPVQSFIAQARKTQDLYAGSRLLSYLARTAFEDFEAKLQPANVELIFPSFKFKDQKPVPSNPNRFAALVADTIGIDMLSSTAKAVKSGVVTRFVNESLARMTFLSPEAKQAATKQLQNHLEIHWAFIPVEATDYHSQFRNIEASMASIKNFRQWNQNPELGRKCAVDGQRNVVVYRKSFSEGSKQRIHKLFKSEEALAVIDPNDERQVKVWSLEPGEGLSAVSYAKRTFEQIAHTFPSTARICLLHVIKQIREWDEFKAIENEPKQLLQHSDDQFLFEENINAQVIKKTGVFTTEAEIAQAVTTIKGLHQRLTSRMQREDKGDLNTKYYAILVFDGDEMGQWLGGHHLEDPSRLKQFHLRMRELLRDFGKRAMEILDKDERGKAVYAGGDDFLGFINLNYLFPVLRELRCTFEESVNKPLRAESQSFRIKEEKNFTFSAGIAIGHYKQPLGMVLEEARSAEREAKKGGRNAFALSIMRHSGGTTRAVFKFGEEDTLTQSLNHLETIREQLGGKHFSNKFMHTLIAETRYWNRSAPLQLLETEIKRLLQRARNKSASDIDHKAMGDAVLALIPKHSEQPPQVQNADIDRFISTLRICDFIYRITNNNEEE